jgi:hypothetical protein
VISQDGAAMPKTKNNQQVALPTLSRLLHIRIPRLPLKERSGIVMRSNMTQPAQEC